MNKLGKVAFVAIAIALIAASLGVNQIVKVTFKSGSSQSYDTTHTVLIMKRDTFTFEINGESKTYAEVITAEQEVVDELQSLRNEYSTGSGSSTALDNAKTRLFGFKMLNAAGKVFFYVGIVTIISLAVSVLVEFVANAGEGRDRFKGLTYTNLALIVLLNGATYVLFYVGVTAIWITAVDSNSNLTASVMPSTSMWMNVGAFWTLVGLIVFFQMYPSEDKDIVVVSNTTTTQPQMMYQQQPMYTQQMPYQTQPQMAYQPQPQPANVPIQPQPQHASMPIQPQPDKAGTQPVSAQTGTQINDAPPAYQNA